MRRKLCRLNYHIELAGFQKKYVAKRTYSTNSGVCRRMCQFGGFFYLSESKEKHVEIKRHSFFSFAVCFFYHGLPDTENKI